MTNDERFLEEVFPLNDHLSAKLTGLKLVPALPDIRVEIPGSDVHQLIDFKLHLEEKRETRWNNLTQCPMTRTYLDDDRSSIAALNHQLWVEFDTGRLRPKFGNVADRDGVHSVDVLTARRPWCFSIKASHILMPKFWEIWSDMETKLTVSSRRHRSCWTRWSRNI